MIVRTSLLHSAKGLRLYQLNPCFPGAVVGLEQTLYCVREDVGTLEMCAVVYSPKINCPIQLSFNVTPSTVPGTASELTVLPKQYQQGVLFSFFSAGTGLPCSCVNCACI